MRKLLLTMVALALVGCGDPATEDARAYTKAPLETPGLMVAGEPRSPMAGVAIDLEPGLAPPRVEEAEPEPTGGAEEAAGGQEVSLAEGVTREQFDQGRELFGGSAGCMACHGPNGGGTQLGPNLTDDEWLNVDAPEVAALAELIQNGVSEPQQYPAPMPAMGGASLTEEQVRALAGYVASIGGG